MGGDITVSSQVSRGSVFGHSPAFEGGEALAVPAKDNPGLFPEAPTRAVTCRVLIADDIEG